MRRPLAILVLLALYASLFEVGVGLARDGAVHHESTATAVSHATQDQDQQGEHGHEADDEAPGTEHGPDHEHGTSSDHCTHAHGAALTASTAPALVSVELPDFTPTVSSTPSDRPSVPLWHPPRA